MPVRPVYSENFAFDFIGFASGGPVTSWDIWTVPDDLNTYVLRHLLVGISLTNADFGEWALFWDLFFSGGGVAIASGASLETSATVVVEQDLHQVMIPQTILKYNGGPALLGFSLSGYKLTPS